MSKYLNNNGLLYLWQKIINKFVAKEAGKGLSTNDFTTSEKTKLAGLNNYVLPEASSSALGGVKVGAGLSITSGVLSTTGGGVADSVEWENVQNKPTFAPSDAEKNVQSDWGTSDSAADSFIKNKPTILTASDVDDAITSKGYQTNEQVTSAINTALSSAVVYKGSVDTLVELNAVSGMKTGWMYNVSEDGMNYVWNGSSWDAQAPTIVIDEITNAEIDSIVAT